MADLVEIRTVGRLAPPARWAGTLSLDIDCRDGRSIAVRQYHDGALRILRPHYLDETGQVCYVIVNPGGAYLGGDSYLIEVSVAAGAELLLTTQSATKIYRTPNDRAQQCTHLKLGERARLELLPDPLIAYREASYGQVTRVDMDPTASLVMAGLPVDSSCFMAEYTHLGSLLVMDARVDRALADELLAVLAPVDPAGQLGITLLDGPGLAVRALSHSTELLNELLAAAVDLLRARWHGQEPLNLRKY